jgi:hypothetical protein
LAGLLEQTNIAIAAQAPNPPAQVVTPTPIPNPDKRIIPNGAEVIVRRLNLRQGPGTRFSIINVLQAGDVLTITNISPDLYWINVITSEGQAGWVSALPQHISLVTNLDEQSVAIGPLLIQSRSLDRTEFGLTEFVWQWDGELTQNQGFEVRVWRDGEVPLGIHNAVLDNRAGKIEALGNNTYRLIVDIKHAPGVTGPGNYLWTVLVVQIGPDYRELGIQADPAPFEGRPAGPLTAQSWHIGMTRKMWNGVLHI